MIIGYNSNEGLLISMKPFQPGNPNYKGIEYEYFVPQQMNLEPDSDLKKEICEKLKKVYLNDRSIDKYRVSINLNDNSLILNSFHSHYSFYISYTQKRQ